MIIKTYHYYIIRKFIKKVLLVSAIFLSLIFFLNIFTEIKFLENYSVFKNLSDLQIKIPEKRFLKKEWVEDDEWNRNYLFFSLNKSELHKLLFGKLADELGIKPSFWFDLYIYDIELGVLVHPYDDRGMDVVGPNKFMINRIYTEFNTWLLDYDLEAMNRWFKS